MAIVKYRGVYPRFICDGCGRMIGQKQKMATITLWIDPKAEPEVHHLHSTMACEQKLMVKSGVQPRLL